MALTWSRTYDWDVDDWRDRAVCRDTDPDLFFPVGTTGMALSQIETAKYVCEQCPARDECLEFALANRESEGIWGGATEKERRRILRQRRKTAAA